MVTRHPDVVAQGVERGDLGRATVDSGGKVAGVAREVAAVDEQDVAVRRTLARDVRRQAGEVWVGVDVRRLNNGQRVCRRASGEHRRKRSNKGEFHAFHECPI